MKTKFSLFERVAGIFVLCAALGAVAVMFSVAYKKGWFSTKIPLQATFNNANGLHVGTKVQMAGLRAGSVTGVELQADNRILVKFKIMKKFFDKVRTDSEIQVIRPFIIGEKILEVSVGSPAGQKVAAGQEVTVRESMDLMELLSGRELGTYLNSMGKLTENLRVLLEAVSDRDRFQSLVDVLDHIGPLVTNVNRMAKNMVILSNQLTNKRRIGRVVQNLAVATDELNNYMPQIAKHGPEAGENFIVALENLALMSKELKKTLPAISAVAPELPQASKRMLEMIDEAVLTLKAMQRNFFLRGKVEEVKEEEAKRLPANE